ncbi:MAG: hypothetical protein ABIG61_02870 [Planctomycetota bacterium]
MRTMRMIVVFIPLLCIIAVGCESQRNSSQSDDYWDRIDAQIAQAKAQGGDVLGDNIKVVVKMLKADAGEFGSIEGLWRYTDENIVVTNNPATFRSSGLRIGVGNEHFTAQLNIVKQSLKHAEESELFIVLLDGTAGYISVGEEIAVPRFFYAGRWYSGVEYDFRHAGRSLKVDVRKLASGQIEMDLTPVFSRFLSDGGNLELTELTTKVRAFPGNAVVISGSSTDEQNVATALFSYGKEDVKKQMLITVTPYAR